jgi:opacity protein-like surface antigen
MRIARFAAAILLAGAGNAFAAADCHVGVIGALGLGSSKHIDAHNGGDFTPGSFSVDGGLGGGTAGCRWPLAGGWMGFEGDYLASSVEGKTADVAPNLGFTSETRVERIGTLRVVAGGNVSQSWAFFGSFGLAAAPTKATVCNPFGTCASGTQTMIGLAGGFSAEYAFTRALRLRLEYLYAGFESKEFLLGFPALPTNVDLSLSQLRLGLDLHF